MAKQGLEHKTYISSVDYLKKVLLKLNIISVSAFMYLNQYDLVRRQVYTTYIRRIYNG